MPQTENFLAGLTSLPKLPPLPQTFMEIAGYPHFENVCSNILQFYLQPNNEHGFDALLLNALMTLIGQEILTDEENIDVRREETTPEGKRIDLVIESDNFVLGIENKIFASAYNPFCLYTEHLKSLSNDRPVYKILLSLHPINPSCELCGFKPIYYDSFLNEIQKNIDNYSGTADRKHELFLRDFIQTIQNLQRQSIMDLQTLEYFRTYQEEINNFLPKVDELTRNMQKKVKQLAEINAPNINTYPIQQGFWNSWQYLMSVVWYEFAFNESMKLHLDICLTPAGWKIRFVVLASKNKQQAQAWLEAREININSFGSSRVADYIGENSELPYETYLEEVKIWTFDMLKRLNLH